MFAKKSFGQNFLHDDVVIGHIVAALEPKAGESVIEIGAGRGALTEKLLAAGFNVTAIEFERDMISVLKERFGSQDNFKLIEDDALSVDFAKISGSAPVKAVGNLPYNISTAILQRLVSVREHFSLLVLMFQREVGMRITASPGDSERGFLTVMTEAAFDVESLFDVSPEAFAPQPNVWSSVVTLTPKPASVGDETAFRELIGVAFAQKRKTILNNLKRARINAESILAESAIDPKRRAETLSLEEWFRVYAAFTKK